MPGLDRPSELFLAVFPESQQASRRHFIRHDDLRRTLPSLRSLASCPVAVATVVAERYFHVIGAPSEYAWTDSRMILGLQLPAERHAHGYSIINESFTMPRVFSPDTVDADMEPETVPIVEDPAVSADVRTSSPTRILQARPPRCRSRPTTPVRTRSTSTDFGNMMRPMGTLPPRLARFACVPIGFGRLGSSVTARYYFAAFASGVRSHSWNISTGLMVRGHICGSAIIGLAFGGIWRPGLLDPSPNSRSGWKWSQGSHLGTSSTTTAAS